MAVGPGPWTEPEAGDVLAELMAREPLFHRPEFGTSRADFQGMISEDFWEVGASGRRYDREYVLDILEERHRKPHQDLWEAAEFECRPVGDNTYLLTYLLRQGDRITRRATIWRGANGMWKALYHQGTLVQSS